VRYSNVVINLIGRDYETRNYSFHRVHVEACRNVAKIAREMGVEKLIHFSALNCSENPPSTVLKGGSQFLKSKWYGEQAVREEYPDAVIFRPSDIWGQEDRFLRYFASWGRRHGRFFPLWKKGDHVIKQPVYVGDVAGGVVNAIFDRDNEGKTYDVVGPERFVLGELIDYMHRVMRKTDPGWGYRRYDMRFDPLHFMKILFNERITPSGPLNTMTWDKLERENITDVPTGNPRLEDLGISPLTTIHERAFWELMPYNAYNYYYEPDMEEFVKPGPPPTVPEA
jgi:NADH dehydrogenase (ubiquinone) 1 alpha subcomplex subunit 9